MFGLKLPPTDAEMIARKVCTMVSNLPKENKKLVLNRLLDDPHIDEKHKKAIRKHECFEELMA